MILQSKKSFLFFSIFNNLFFEWVKANLNTESSSIKEEFKFFLIKEFLESKTNKFFDIITNYPESHSVLVDIKSVFVQTDVKKLILLIFKYFHSMRIS
jgi:hypothetical protein